MSSSGDDKTRIQKVGAKGDESASVGPSDATQLNQDSDERRLAAEKKARLLEKRLAEISAKKKSRSKNKPAQISSPPSDDKTRIDSREQAASENENKTRIKRAATPADDKTRFQPREAANSSDKTEFQPRSQKALDISVHPDTVVGADDLVAPAPPTLRLDPKDHALEGQEILKNRFIFEKVLGSGGMGVVYKAKDLLKVEAQDKDPYVAIKVLSDDFKTHPEAFIALQRESRKTQRIAHPNIVNVYDFDRDGDTVFMTMEYLEGRPLDKLISQYKATGLPEEDAWKILEGISAALIYAHEQKIIHSDFKPGNIYVTDQNSAKVFDFGIARAVAKAEAIEESVDDKTVFDAGNLGALTPAYASMEMLDGKTPDVRDDIYALGCIAYEMFTGNHPFNRIHADEAMRRKLKPKRIPNVSKRQWRVIEQALAFKREDRIATVNEFWQQLTHKRSSAVLIAGVAMILLTAVSIFSYQSFIAPQENEFSESEIRSEIERKVLIEQNKKTLAELLGSLEFDESWQRKLASTLGTLEGFLGADDAWLMLQRDAAFEAYFNKIISLIAGEEFERARSLLESARAYTTDENKLVAMLAQITEGEALMAKREAEEKARNQRNAEQQRVSSQQQAVQKEKNEAFDVAMATVNKQLLCRSTMNMSDIDIAVGKLRSLNLSRYRKAENEIIDRLAACVSKIGRSFPDRAEEFKKRAARTFPNNRVIANIRIEPKDPCDVSLAGLGARGSRAICRDILKSEGETFGKGPALVVIPEKGSVKPFAIGKYEITIDDFNNFCENTKVCSVREGDNTKLPITNISAAQINEYLAWLNSKSKRKYRLPTLAEWSYAARAESAKLDSNRNCRLDSRGIKKGGALIKASSGQQNPWGLINYLGNAQELVLDRGSYYALGGSAETAMEDCVVSKSASHSGNADKLTGFRVLREIE